jgi:hypothetical protein
MIKPLKVVFEMLPTPHIILFEAFSKPVGTLTPLNSEMVRNLLVQFGYTI